MSYAEAQSVSSRGIAHGRMCRVAPSLFLATVLAATGPTPADTPTTQPARRAETQPASRPTVPTDEFQLEDSGLEDLRLLSLEVPTVVSAARHEQKMTSVPYAISVITREDIRLSGARSVPDALRLVPGMDVAEMGYGNAAVSPRGLHGLIVRQVLVLVDGRQLFDSLFGGTLWGAWPFQLEDIERIEVIRDSGGVAWGANAAGGVINIITKDPAAQQGLTVVGGGGSRGVHKEYAGYGIHIDKLRLRASGEYEGTDGFRKGGSFLQPLADDYKAVRSNVHAIYEASPDDTLTISGGSGVTSDGMSTTPLASLGAERVDGSQASFILGRWSHRIATDNRIELTGYVNDFWVSPGLKVMDYRYQQFAFQLGHTFKPTSEHTLSWGFDSRVDLLDAGNSSPSLLTKDSVGTAILGLYVQDEWRFAPRWALNLGARIDYEFYGGFQPSARAALSYAVTDDSSIYAAVSRAFQMPPVGTRFVDFPLLNGLVWVQSDQDMSAVQSLSYEAGYRARFFKRLDTNLNLYCHSYYDNTPLVTRLGPPGLINTETRNASDALLYGLEWEGKYAVTDRLTLLGNYTFQRMDWFTHFMGADMMTSPKHKFMIGARYSPTDDLHLSAHAYYVDAVRSPDALNAFALKRLAPYVRLDLRAEQEFWKDKASIAVGVRNLLDPDHPEGATRFLNHAEVPRMVYAEMRIRLD